MLGFFGSQCTQHTQTDRQPISRLPQTHTHIHTSHPDSLRGSKILFDFLPTKCTVVAAAATSSIRQRDCSRQVGCLSPRPSTPSTYGQHTCCHRNRKTNPSPAAALSVADRIAACHRRPVRRSTSHCHKPYLCFQYSAVEAGECVADSQTHTGFNSGECSHRHGGSGVQYWCLHGFPPLNPCMSGGLVNMSAYVSVLVLTVLSCLLGPVCHGRAVARILETLMPQSQQRCYRFPC